MTSEAQEREAFEVIPPIWERDIGLTRRAKTRIGTFIVWSTPSAAEWQWAWEGDSGDDTGGSEPTQSKAMEAATADYERRARCCIRPVPRSSLSTPETFQQRVQPWMMACFGPEVSADRLERGDRLLEEVLELLQSGEYPRERVAALTDYVWSRPAGEPTQEVGGVMVTLAAHCLAHGVDMHAAAETELARIWTKVVQIRAKQAAKPKGSALPIAVAAAPPVSAPSMGVESDLDTLVGECWTELCERDDRTSPPDTPDMCLITMEELAQFMGVAATSAVTPSPKGVDAVEVAKLIEPHLWGDDFDPGECMDDGRCAGSVRDYAVMRAKGILAYLGIPHTSKEGGKS